MARKRLKQVYERVFFDRLLFVGIIFLAVSYILRDGWGGAFAEAVTVIVGIVWSYRAMTTNPHREMRLLALLVMVLIGCLMATNLGVANGLL
jgi:uncharacterized membrane protein